jgi:NAD(P)-dependent dehydrogenase (short-subunit alcohol dehydrogenase family)
MTILDRMNLSGKVALVTGGAGDMGKAIATQLRNLGAKVVLADLKDSVAQVAESLSTSDAKVDWVKVDVTDSKSVDAGVAETVRRHGGLHVMVANAGISYEQSTLEHSDENWRRVMSVNLDGAFFCIRAAGRQMVNNGGGSIIAISSICSVTASRPEVHIGYDVSKAGVGHMCRNVAVEWASKNIRVNAVGPGYTDTVMLDEVGKTRPAVMKQWLEDMPIHRLMAPREIADTVAFLASDAASGITGHELMVDGGYSVS